MKHIYLTLILSLIHFSTFAALPPSPGGTQPPSGSNIQQPLNIGNQTPPNNSNPQPPNAGNQTLPEVTPPSNSDAQLPPVTSSQPPPGTNTLPSSSENTQPLPNNGGSPPPNGGGKPPVSDNGNQPISDISDRSPPDGGTEPPVNSGNSPPINNGEQFPPDSGVQPASSEGTRPPPDKNTQPSEGNSSKLPPKFLPSPVEEQSEEGSEISLPPPPVPKKVLPPPPPEKEAKPVIETKILAPPPKKLPGTVTRNQELHEQANLFKLNWQAQQTNIEAFTKMHEVPMHRVLPDGDEQVMVRVTDNEPIFYGTDTPVSDTTVATPQAMAANSDVLWQLGLTGNESNCTAAWDVGAVLTSHQEFNERIIQGDTPNNTSDHSTHVVGTMTALGADAAAQGIAYEGCLNAYDWENADSEMATAAAEGLTISNHSYGVMSGWVNMGAEGTNKWCWYGNPNVSETEDYKFGFYSSEAKNLDQIAYDAPY